MDKVDTLFEVLAQANLGTTHPPDIPMFEMGINVRHLGVTGKGDDAILHSVAICDEIKWGFEGEPADTTLKLGRPPSTPTRAWLYVHEHFDLFAHTTLSAVCSKLYRPHNLHLLTDPENTFNLRVMNILAAHAQNTPYANQFVFTVPITHPINIAETSCGWVGLDTIHVLGIRVGGQALAHVLMHINTPASFVDVWVCDTTRLQTLMLWLRARFPDLIMGSRVDGCVVVCRPGVGCACRIHLEGGRDTPIMKIQPDFTQGMFDGHAVQATPRCLLALKSNTSTDSGWMGRDSGMKVVGPTTLCGKPIVNTNPDMSKKVWNLITQYGCIDVSTQPGTDDRYFTKRGPNPPTRFGYVFQTMPLEQFLANPSAGVGHALHIYMDRLYVQSRDGDYLYIRPGVQVLESLLAYLNTSYGNYTTPTSVVVRVESPIHAQSGGRLAHVPVGCSISGVVWWYPGCVRINTVYFSVVDPQVHPGHISHGIH